MDKGLALGVQAREGWEKGRVDIEDAFGKGPEEQGRHEPHVTREADKLHPRLPERIGNGSIMIFSAASTMVEDNRRDGSFRGSLEAQGVPYVRDHECDRSPEATLGARVDQGLQVRPATADENPDRLQLKVTPLPGTTDPIT